jgi:AbrB family looped-hinge helix DNA binding protein
MTYLTTITSKGQITIPKAIRRVVALQEHSRVSVRAEKKGRRIVLEAAPTLLDLAGTFRPTKVYNAVKIREYMEKHYKRA